MIFTPVHTRVRAQANTHVNTHTVVRQHRVLRCIMVWYAATCWIRPIAKVDMPYKPGTCFDLLKWKPLKHQTIDFRVDVKFRERIGYMHTCVRTCVLTHPRMDAG